MACLPEKIKRGSRSISFSLDHLLEKRPRQLSESSQTKLSLVSPQAVFPVRTAPVFSTMSDTITTPMFSKEEERKLVPFSEPQWMMSNNFKSPYYSNKHVQFAKKVRAFVESKLVPFVEQWDEAGGAPLSLHREAYEAGVLGAMWPEEYGGTPPQGGCDAFMDLILWDELARCCSGGVLACVFVSLAIALPPVLQTGSDYIKNKVCRAVITGKKIICLAITEPTAGSDVAAIRTTAVDKGDYYVVNGQKKFTTSGVNAHFYVVAVRTGAQGMMGISLLLLEKGMPGLTARRMKTQGWLSSNTAYLNFDDVKVPKQNLIGVENLGFLPIMHQFNHERFIGVVSCARGARMCVQMSIEFARNRTTFNKRLVDHQVIQHKIAEMVRRVEMLQAQLELYAYQMDSANQKNLGRYSALLKVSATKILEFCAREASQIFGGASYLRTGIGSRVERLYREVRVNAIGGGSEEILLSMAMKQSKL